MKLKLLLKERKLRMINCKKVKKIPNNETTDTARSSTPSIKFIDFILGINLFVSIILSTLVT